ncbi:MAG: hypothetical protein ACK5NF_02645 [Bacilli bacterium]
MEVIVGGITNSILLLGDNYSKKKLIVNAIEQYFSKKTSRISLKYNDKPVDKDLYDCLVIPSLYEIETELKIGSSSTLKKDFRENFRI